MADVATIAERIAGDATTAARRPNLTAVGGIDEIRALLKIREPLYRETAHLTVSTEGRSVAEIADQIVAHLPRSTAS
jgi:shikimate kinase